MGLFFRLDFVVWERGVVFFFKFFFIGEEGQERKKRTQGKRKKKKRSQGKRKKKEKERTR